MPDWAVYIDLVLFFAGSTHLQLIGEICILEIYRASIEVSLVTFYYLTTFSYLFEFAVKVSLITFYYLTTFIYLFEFAVKAIEVQLQQSDCIYFFVYIFIIL